MSIKHAVIQYLRADSGVSALVGTRITPRRAPIQSAYPLLVVNKISEFPEITHSGDDYTTTNLQISIIAQNDLSTEQIQSAIKNRLHLLQGTIITSYQVLLCTLEDSGDSSEDEYFEEDFLLSNLDYKINWRTI